MQFWYGLLLAGALCGFGVMAYRHQKSNDLKRIDLALEQELTVMLAELRVGLRPPRRLPPARPGPLPPRERGLREFIESDSPIKLLEENNLSDDYFVVWGRDGIEVGRVGTTGGSISLPAPASDEGTNNPGRTRDHFREVYRFRPAGDCLLLGRSIRAEQKEWSQLIWKLMGSGLGILVIGLVGGWIFLSRSLRPIQSISRSARKFASGELETRIPEQMSGGELGQLTRDLNETFDQLESAFARQSRFTADAAHELRTPVSVILSHAQGALVREREPEAYREALESCERGAKRLRELIDSLLTLTRIDADNQAPAHEEVDLATIVGDSIEFMKPLVDERHLHLESDLLAAPCRGSAARLHQVFLNLLTNAINFSTKDGAIRISTGRDSSHAWAKVTDEGKGIPEEHLPHLFERFYRVDPSRKREAGGAGLGLAICSEILTSLGGSIEVESEEGVGTTFTVKVPLGD